MNLLGTLLPHNEGTTRRLLEQSGGLTDGQLDQDFDLGLSPVRLVLHHTGGAVDGRLCAP